MGAKWFRQGKKEKKCKQARYSLNRSNIIVANNNDNFDFALAA